MFNFAPHGNVQNLRIKDTYKLYKKERLIRDLRAEGISFAKIAGILKVNRDTIRRYYYTFIDGNWGILSSHISFILQQVCSVSAQYLLGICSVSERVIHMSESRVYRHNTEISTLTAGRSTNAIISPKKKHSHIAQTIAKLPPHK